MKHLAQPLGTALLEGGVDPLGSGRALAQRLFYAPLVEALYGGACCLGIAAQRAGDPVGVLSSGAGKQDLAPTEDEGFRRAQALLQCLALGVRERTHEDRSFHSDQRSTLRTTCSEDALGLGLLAALALLLALIHRVAQKKKCVLGGSPIPRTDVHQIV